MTAVNLDRLYAAAVTARGVADAASADAATAVAAANAPGAPPWALADAEYAVEAHRLANARARAADAAIEDAEADAAAEDAAEAPLSPGVLALVRAVQDHASARYERGGWDVIVETFTDAELAAVIAGARTPAGAIRKAAAVARLHGERRREVEATAW